MNINFLKSYFKPKLPLTPVARKPANCILYYDLSQAGTEITDLSGQNNIGTAYNTSDDSLGKIFNGSSAYIAIANQSVLNITSAPLSMGMWIKPASDAANSYLLAKNTSATTDIQYALFYQASPQNISMRLENNTYGYTATNATPASVWTLVFVVWDGTNTKYYINGASNGTPGSYNGSLTNRNYLRIGRRETSTGYFKGEIGEVWMTNSILSESNITNLYNLTKGRYGL